MSMFISFLCKSKPNKHADICFILSVLSRVNVIIIGIMVTCVAGPRPGQCRHWRCWKVETGVFVGITPWCPVVPRPADICSATGQCAALLPIQTAGAGLVLEKVPSEGS